MFYPVQTADVFFETKKRMEFQEMELKSQIKNTEDIDFELFNSMLERYLFTYLRNELFLCTSAHLQNIQLNANSPILYLLHVCQRRQ